jgi:hypothetical protein
MLCTGEHGWESNNSGASQKKRADINNLRSKDLFWLNNFIIRKFGGEGHGRTEHFTSWQTGSKERGNRK